MQFDGSCLEQGTPLASCGAGVAAWLVTDEGVSLIAQRAVPLVDGKDSAEAEAFASAQAILLAVELKQKAAFEEVEFQGDNTAAVGFWSGTSRFKGLRIQHILEEARDAILYQLGVFEWKYLPRECNSTADHLAGIASQLLLDLRRSEASEEELLALQCEPQTDQVLGSAPLLSLIHI